VGTRVAYVSGGGTGIGKAIASALVADGMNVVLFGRREAVLEAAAKELSAAFPDRQVGYQPADLTDPGQVRSAVAGAVGQVGEAVDVIVNNAGGTPPAGPGDGAQLAAEWRATFDLNVLTAVLLTNEAASRLVRPGGRVITISSVAAVRGSGGGAYGPAKAALHAWSYDLARNLGQEGITANVVAPGFVPDTEFWTGRLTDDLYRARVGETLVGRAGTPDDVAGAVRWLASPDTGWVTGQIIQVNGGVALGRG
jgi:NAD(P)-dependent dehydrogenase (short-subunit alcohol dehydrogenase family)